MARVASLAPQTSQALAGLRPPAVSPELLEQELRAYRASRPAVFHQQQKGKQKVQKEYPQAFLPRLEEAAAYPRNRWS